jgi:hypothetical protein
MFAAFAAAKAVATFHASLGTDGRPEAAEVGEVLKVCGTAKEDAAAFATVATGRAGELVVHFVGKNGGAVAAAAAGDEEFYAIREGCRARVPANRHVSTLFYFLRSASGHTHTKKKTVRCCNEARPDEAFFSIVASGAESPDKEKKKCKMAFCKDKG